MEYKQQRKESNMNITKQLAKDFYDMVDGGIHPTVAYEVLDYYVRMDLMDRSILAGIAARLAEDKVNYPDSMLLKSRQENLHVSIN